MRVDEPVALAGAEVQDHAQQGRGRAHMRRGVENEGVRSLAAARHDLRAELDPVVAGAADEGVELPVTCATALQGVVAGAANDQVRAEPPDEQVVSRPRPRACAARRSQQGSRA
jgi:hypothetical protein